MSARAHCFFVVVAMLAGCGSPAPPSDASDIEIDVVPDVFVADTLDSLIADAAETASDGDIQADRAADNEVAAEVGADVPLGPDADALNADSIEVTQATDTQDTNGGPIDSGDAQDVGCQCGDGICTTSCGETQATCPADCIGCGNGICEPGEGPKSCAIDCCGSCGDGKCKGYDCGESSDTCAKDCGNACGNKVCDKGESPATCAEDCVWQVCGNGVCEASDGGPDKCPQDCSASCGDGVCNKGEDFLGCPVDCGYCGDGFCVAGLGEAPVTCPGDCDKNPDCDPALPGDVTKCNDGNPCTIEQCNPVGHCKHLPTAGDCDDGNVCTLGDTCMNAMCTPGAATSCDDENPCTADSCDAKVGCKHKATTAACDDGNLCTVADVCAAGSCVGGTAMDCDDGNVCTADSCDVVNGCAPIPADGGKCTDGNLCTTGDACSGGSCGGVGALDCDDGNPCTADSCLSSVGCKHKAVSGDCSDANVCTEGDQCLNGSCTAGNVVTCKDGNPCTEDGCDAVTGCAYAALSFGNCSDGSACTIADVCTDGICLGEAITCADNNVCTDDSCLSKTGCVYAANAQACSDANACTLADTCTSTTCIGAAFSCDDGNDCTNDICDGAGGCIHVNSTSNCNDNSACTTADVCSGGACIATLVNCDDLNTCTTDSCDPASGCKYVAGNATVCDDGSLCTLNDTCVGTVCAGTNATEGTYCDVGKCAFGVCIACPHGMVSVSVNGSGYCAFDYPIWGNRPISPTGVYTDNGDGTVSDSQTELVWQKVQPNAKYSWTGASSYCDGLILGGASDWRLPTMAEAESLVDYAAYPAIDSLAFPGAKLDYTWTTVRWPYSKTASGVWLISYQDGNLGAGLTTASGPARCVRGGKGATYALAARFTAGPVGTVFEAATGLTWQKTVSISAYSGAEAAVACASLSLVGSGWRLPNIRELRSLLERTSASSYVDASVFPNSPLGYVWSNTLMFGSTTNDWVFPFCDGNDCTNGIPGLYVARCVR